MCDWMAVAADLLAPIVKLMQSKILTSKVVQNDDTPVPVQDHDGKGIKTARLWVSIGDHSNPYVAYYYTPDRSAAGPEKIFKDYKGYLQADAYSAYDGLYKSGEIVEVGCMMHARRKFYEARTSDAERSHQALAWIGLLYKVEREPKETTTPLSGCGTSFEGSDRGRSLSSSTPGWKPSCRRSGPRARSARRLVTP
jgi:transposase